jgi:hypothetical protein
MTERLRLSSSNARFAVATYLRDRKATAISNPENGLAHPTFGGLMVALSNKKLMRQGE